MKVSERSIRAKGYWWRNVKGATCQVDDMEDQYMILGKKEVSLNRLIVSSDI